MTGSGERAVNNTWSPSPHGAYGQMEKTGIKKTITQINFNCNCNNCCEKEVGAAKSNGVTHLEEVGVGRCWAGFPEEMTLSWHMKNEGEKEMNTEHQLQIASHFRLPSEV